MNTDSLENLQNASIEQETKNDSLRKLQEVKVIVNEVIPLWIKQ